MYRNEEQVGRAIADSGVPGGPVRHHQAAARYAGRARATIMESLKALDTDYVDLWLVHWPPRGRNLVPLWQDLLAARDDGLTRAVGVSNYSIGQIDELIEATGEQPAVNQIPWNPSRYDAGLLAAHADRGVALEGYSPLKGTRLRDRTLGEIADKSVSPRPGRPALAPRHRRHRHPQAPPPRAHRAELRRVRLLPDPRRSIPPRTTSSPPAWPRAAPHPRRVPLRRQARSDSHPPRRSVRSRCAVGQLLCRPKCHRLRTSAPQPRHFPPIFPPRPTRR